MHTHYKLVQNVNQILLRIYSSLNCYLNVLKFVKEMYTINAIFI